MAFDGKHVVCICKYHLQSSVRSGRGNRKNRQSRSWPLRESNSLKPRGGELSECETDRVWETENLTGGECLHCHES